MAFRWCRQSKHIRRCTACPTTARRCTASRLPTLGYPLCRNKASISAASELARHESLPNDLLFHPGALGQQAKAKESDREFFSSLLSSAATNREAKAYLTRLKNPQAGKQVAVRIHKESPANSLTAERGREDEQATRSRRLFDQPLPNNTKVEEQETLHIALIKLKDVALLSQTTLFGIAKTLSQLNRLSVSPCVVVEASSANCDGDEVDRLIDAIDRFDDSARRIDNTFTVTAAQTNVTQRKLLLRTLCRGHIPIVTNIAYNTDSQGMTVVPVHDAVFALASVFANSMSESKETSKVDPATTPSVSLDRIITIDSAGGIPSDRTDDGKYVFLNLMQEYADIRNRLETQINKSNASGHPARTHLLNMTLLNKILQMLPSTSSGLMTTHEEAANLSEDNTRPPGSPNIGTRRQRNALVHNLLTDKPAYSSSLPVGRLSGKISADTRAPMASHSSFVKRGIPVSILPNPSNAPWTSTAARLKLTDPSIDLPKLIHLIEDSFGRKLDSDDYLRRVNDRIAGVIIAGNYEGGAILTWETPSDTPDAEPVPYLDKFAVLKRSQGAGGVADIVFNAMVRSCFPDGVCWRSRKDNPVNKWYFERSRCTWKIPDTNWTMFFTTPGVELNSKRFKEYESVCRDVLPSWDDKRKPAD